MIAPLVPLLLQAAPAPAPTVGDTVWLVRSVAVPAGRSVRAPDWEPEGAVELLGRPQVVVRGGTAMVRWPAVAWSPGTHSIEVPGPLLVAASGAVDSLPARTETFTVRSVLPPAPPDSQIAPQPPAGFVPRLVRSWLPPAVLVGATLLLLLPLHWWWRRRGRPQAAPAGAGPPSAPPLERWARAGERHAVASAVALRLRRRIASLVPAAHAGLDTPGVLDAVRSARPDWPVGELAALLETLDRIRFAPGAHGAADAVLELDRRSAAIEERLGPPSPSETAA
jgi:hypothetical protein